jgi:hypothetical protein
MEQGCISTHNNVMRHTLTGLPPHVSANIQ